MCDTVEDSCEEGAVTHDLGYATTVFSGETCGNK